MQIHFNRSALAAGVLLACLSVAAFAENVGVTRALVTKGDVSGANREASIYNVQIAPAGMVDWHTHPGDETSYVAEGTLSLMIADQPPRKVAAGEGFIIPAGVVHMAKNETATPLRIITIYTLDKGKPIATPAEGPRK